MANARLKLVLCQQIILAELSLYQGAFDGSNGVKMQSAITGLMLTTDAAGLGNRPSGNFFNPHEPLPKGWSWAEDTEGDAIINYQGEEIDLSPYLPKDEPLVAVSEGVNEEGSESGTPDDSVADIPEGTPELGSETTEPVEVTSDVATTSEVAAQTEATNTEAAETSSEAADESAGEGTDEAGEGSVEDSPEGTDESGSDSEDTPRDEAATVEHEAGQTGLALMEEPAEASNVETAESADTTAEAPATAAVPKKRGK